MDFTALHYIFTGTGVGIACFSAISLLGKQKNVPRMLLFLLLILCALNILHPFLPVFVHSSGIFSGVRVNEPLQFLLAPLMYLYVRSLFKPERKLRVLDLLHALPTFAVVVLTLASVASSIEAAGSQPLFSLLSWTAVLVQALTYLLPSLRMVHAYARKLRNQVSNLAGVDINWVHWFFVVFLFLYASYAVMLAFMIHSPEFPPVRAYLSAELTAAVWVLSFRILRQKDADLAVLPEPQKETLPETSALSLKSKLEKLMGEEKLYLDPELSLADLSEAAGAPRNHVSFVINQYFQRNFYDFVNQRRVDEVIRLMRESERDSHKIIALAFDAGFNSKQTFNTVFKKITGKTPSEYRKLV